ncbi:MAG TPA: DUF4412 domain-containing protein [Polyangiaceae bacterium]
MMHLRTITVFAACLLSVAACDRLRGTKGGADGGAASSGGGGVSGLAAKALSLVTSTGESFEGDITMNDAHTGKPPKVEVYEVKGDKLRLEDPERHNYVIFNGAEKKIIEVDDAKKTAMVIEVDQMEKMSAQMAPAAAHAPSTPPPSEWESSVDMAAGTDVIAGYACDKWKITETNKKTGKIRKTDACLAKGIGFPDMTMGRGGTTKSWMAKLVADKFFPLRVVMTEDGVEQEKMEVTKIEKKTLAASRFEVPPGYAVTDMAEMMKGLQNMRPHR